jgi:hypothetical protein
MSPLKQLFRLEIEFHHRLRTQVLGTGDAASPHTSYALQSGYEPLPRDLGPITFHDIESLRERLTLSANPRDVLPARDSLKQLLGLHLLDN